MESGEGVQSIGSRGIVVSIGGGYEGIPNTGPLGCLRLRIVCTGVATGVVFFGRNGDRER